MPVWLNVHDCTSFLVQRQHIVLGKFRLAIGRELVSPSSKWIVPSPKTCHQNIIIATLYRSVFVCRLSLQMFSKHRRLDTTQCLSNHSCYTTSSNGSTTPCKRVGCWNRTAHLVKNDEFWQRNRPISTWVAIFVFPSTALSNHSLTSSQTTSTRRSSVFAPLYERHTPLLSTVLFAQIALTLTANCQASWVTPADITQLLSKSPSKTCILDPMPTHFVKLCHDVMAVPITNIINKT